MCGIVKFWRQKSNNLDFEKEFTSFFVICALILPCKQMLEKWESE